MDDQSDYTWTPTRRQWAIIIGVGLLTGACVTLLALALQQPYAAP